LDALKRRQAELQAAQENIVKSVKIPLVLDNNLTLGKSRDVTTKTQDDYESCKENTLSDPGHFNDIPVDVDTQNTNIALQKSFGKNHSTYHCQIFRKYPQKHYKLK
jgi:hypothetical protein